MNTTTYIIRNYRPTDFDDYVKLNAEVEKLEPTGRVVSSDILSESLGRPDYAPEKDMFIAETAGNIVGFINITPELGIRRVIVDCLVHPEHRRKGLATKLLGHATRRARELKVKIIHVSIKQDNEAARKVLPRLGFRVVHRFFELKLPLAESQLPETKRRAFTCRHLHPREEDKLARIQNRCFKNTWGYNPDTIEGIAYSLQISHGSPEDVILICEADSPVGYCWTKVNHEAESADDKRKGRILMLGVDPDYRGKGIGKIALLVGLTYLKDKEVRTVELTVDSQNKTARALYDSLSFQKWATSLWYEKALD